MNPFGDFDPMKDGTQQYNRVYPFGQIGRVSVTGNIFDDQVKSLIGNRQIWTLGADGKYQADEEETWRWDVPKEWNGSYFTSSPPQSKDRYSAFMALPDYGRKMEAELCFFDKTTGLLWRKAFSLQPAFEAVKDTVSVPASEKFSIGRTGKPVVTVNKAGTRILALIPFEQPRLTLLFVYDNKGELIKTSVFRKRIVRQEGSDLSHSRTPDGERFRFEFRCDYSEKDASGKATSHYGYESNLIDSKGNLIGRFMASPKYPLWMRFSKDGSRAYSGMGYPNTNYIYKMPK